MDEQVKDEIRSYHSFLVGKFIDCGIVIHPGQISSLQSFLNSYLHQHDKEAVSGDDGA